MEYDRRLHEVLQELFEAVDSAQDAALNKEEPRTVRGHLAVASVRLETARDILRDIP